MCVPCDQERSEWHHGSHDPVKTEKFVDIIIYAIWYNIITLQFFQSVHVVGNLAWPQEQVTEQP